MIDGASGNADQRIEAGGCDGHGAGQPLAARGGNTMGRGDAGLERLLQVWVCLCLCLCLCLSRAARGTLCCVVGPRVHYAYAPRVQYAWAIGRLRGLGLRASSFELRQRNPGGVVDRAPVMSTVETRGKACPSWLAGLPGAGAGVEMGRVCCAWAKGGLERHG